MPIESKVTSGGHLSDVFLPSEDSKHTFMSSGGSGGMRLYATASDKPRNGICLPVQACALNSEVLPSLLVAVSALANWPVSLVVAEHQAFWTGGNVGAYQ